MAEQVKKIKKALNNRKTDLKKLLEGGVKEREIEHIAAELGLDKKIFSFLIQSSARPSIEAGMEGLLGELDSETWQKGHCPVCGSLPSLSLLKGEGEVISFAPIAVTNGESVGCPVLPAATRIRDF
jgi:FdhE protein